MNRFSFLLASGIALPTACTACHACAALSDGPIRITDESALIVWDAKSGTEQFVRRASFETNAKDFGFVVPTPSCPILDEADDSLFERLETQLEPKVEHRTRKPVISFWLLGGRERTFTKAATSMKAITEDEPEVVEQKRIGDYDATVLRASDTRTLGKWLRANHYTLSLDFETWAVPYTRRGWFLTAFKVVANAQRKTASLKALRLTFKSDSPFYPYREPKRAQQLDGGRTLRLFYIGSNRPQGRIEDGHKQQPWLAPIEYSATLDASALNGEHIALPSVPLRLTAFTDSSSPRPGWGDLNFVPASDQSELAPPPHIIWENHDIYIPLDILALAVFVGGFWWWDARSKRASAGAAQIQST